MIASLDWTAVLASSVEAVFARGWALPAEPLAAWSAVSGVTAVVPLCVGAERLQASLTLDQSLAVVVAQRLGSAPIEAAAQAKEATAECLNLLAGRLAGAVGGAADLVLGTPSVQNQPDGGQVIAIAAWQTAAGRFALTVAALA